MLNTAVFNLFSMDSLWIGAFRLADDEGRWSSKMVRTGHIVGCDQIY